VPVAFRADLRFSRAEKFGVKQMPTEKRSRAGMFCIYLNYGRKEDLRGPRCNRISDFRGANALLSPLCLICDQSFRHGWSFAGCRLEFLATRIVVRNKEVLNLGD
jgi:hypothetical protein